MEMARLDPDDTAAVEELFALQQAVHAADTPDSPFPPREEFLASVRQTSPEGRSLWLLARIDGRLVGAGVLRLPDIDNRHMAQIEVQVRPAHRRRGVGRALLERLRQQARAEQRSTLVGWVFRSVPGGPHRGDAGVRFLAAMGSHPGSRAPSAGSTSSPSMRLPSSACSTSA